MATPWHHVQGVHKDPTQHSRYRCLPRGRPAAKHCVWNGLLETGRGPTRPRPNVLATPPPTYGPAAADPPTRAYGRTHNARVLADRNFGTPTVRGAQLRPQPETPSIRNELQRPPPHRAYCGFRQ